MFCWIEQKSKCNILKSHKNLMQGVRTGIMVDHGGAFSSKVNNRHSWRWWKWNYYDQAIFRSPSICRQWKVCRNCMEYCVIAVFGLSRFERSWLLKEFLYCFGYLCSLHVISWHIGIFSVMSNVGKWFQLISFRDDKTKIKDFAEKICSEQYADQWVTKFCMNPDTLDKLVKEIRPFVKTMQGIIAFDIWWWVQSSFCFFGFFSVLVLVDTRCVVTINAIEQIGTINLMVSISAQCTLYHLGFMTVIECTACWNSRI